MVGAEAFKDCEQLRYAELNEGLEVLGEKWNYGDNELRGMVFNCSGIESIRILSTLKTIDAYTFAECNNLKAVEFSEGLEKIEVCAFLGSNIESISLPSSTRVICGSTFAFCENLRIVRLNEGLVKLGTKERFRGQLF